MYQFPPALRSAYEAMSIPFVYFQFENGRTVPVLISDGFCRIIGANRELLTRRLESGFFDRIHPDDAGRVAQVTSSFANRTSDYDTVFRIRIRDEYHYVHAFGRWETMPDGTRLAVLAYSDVSSAENVIRFLNQKYKLFQEDQFYRDALTGLPNLNYFHEFADSHVHSLRTEGKTPMLLYSDVDSMQFYNTQYGFSNGNELLRQISVALQRQFPDALLIRGADDHFVLIDAWEGEEITGKKLSVANGWIRAHAYGNTTGIQAGIYVFNSGDSLTAEAVDHARNALKRIGSDLNTTYRIYSQMADEQYWNERYIVQNLDQALQEQWIKVFYQGIGLIETKRTASFEALARWNDPNRGTIFPGEFIPVLEKYHLLYKLDLYMVEQVCKEVVLRAGAGLPLTPVSVNFSAQDFDYRDIPTEIDDLYTRYDMEKFVPRNFFVVEITERDIATATERFQDQLRRLRAMGYQLWLDDFGSGYSSLNVFSRFDIDMIKFDMALIRDLDSRNGLNRKIISAMTSIAHGMGIHTLAEGIETEQQWSFLKEAGVELGQGFLYRKPEALSSILFKLSSGALRPACESGETLNRFFSREDRLGPAPVSPAEAPKADPA